MEPTFLALLFVSATQTFSLPPGLLSATCYVESHFKLNAVNLDDGGSPSEGVCQIKYTTAKWLGFTGTSKQLRDPSNNVYYAAKYLRYQLDRYGEDPRKASAAYNAGRYLRSKLGPGAVNKQYVAKVFKAWSQGK